MDPLPIALFIVGTVLLVIDWGQTRHIARNPDRFFEKNPFLGLHPSINMVNAYFAFWVIFNAALVLILEGWLLLAYQIGLIAVQLMVTINNRRIGIKIDF